LGSSRAAWVLTRPRHASLPVSKCIHHDNGQLTHRRYSRILPPLLSDDTIIIHQPIAQGSPGHDRRLPESSSRRPLRQRREDTVAALADLAAIFKLKLQPTLSHEPHASPPKFAQLPSNIPSPMPIIQDHKRQFSPQTSQTCHYLRGWSPREHSVIHLRGCPLDPDDSLLATCPKITFAE
jgi:hypothetical protein